MSDALPGGASGSLADLLALEAAGDGSFTSVRHQANRAGKLFGGQVFAHALKAAGFSAPGLMAHSAQATFLRAGAMDSPIVYTVKPARDGRIYAARTVTATQDGKKLLTLSASFKIAEPDLCGYHPAEPLDWPLPDALADVFRAQDDGWGPRRFPVFPGLDVRPCDIDLFLLRKPGPRCFRTWFRALGIDASDLLEKQAALAYLSDFAVPLTALAPHAEDLESARLFVPTLNHGIWFTGTADPADWVAYRTECRWAGDGRTLTWGDLRSADGRPVASTIQENVIRRPAARGRD